MTIVSKVKITGSKSGFNLSFIDVIFVITLFLLPILLITYQFLYKYHSIIIEYNNLAEVYNQLTDSDLGWKELYWFNFNIITEFDKIIQFTYLMFIFISFLFIITLYFKLKSQIKQKKFQVSYINFFIIILVLLLPFFFLLYHYHYELNSAVVSYNRLVDMINKIKDKEVYNKMVDTFLGVELGVSGGIQIDFFLYPFIITNLFVFILIYGKIRSGK
jgi:hypothetical protein